MKNKIGKGALVCLCLLMLYSRSVRAYDAFVVEEEAVIGTQESVTENVQQEPSQPVVPKEEPQEQKPVRKEPGKQEEKVDRKEPVKQEKAEETISQNTPEPAFRVPVRRQQAKVEEEPWQEVQRETPPESVAEDVLREDMSQPQQKEVSWWFPVISGFFLLFGIARIVYRLLIRGGKL